MLGWTHIIAKTYQADQRDALSPRVLRFTAESLRAISHVPLARKSSARRTGIVCSLRPIRQRLITVRPVPRVDQGGGVVNWWGWGWGWGWGVRAPSAQCRPRWVWGHAPAEFFFINLIEYGVSFCILKYKTLSLYLWKGCAGGTR